MFKKLRDNWREICKFYPMSKGGHNDKPNCLRPIKTPPAMGGMVPQDVSKSPYINFKKKDEIEFKVEKVYDFKKGGRYFFVLTTDKPITDRMHEVLKETFKANNKRLMKDLGIISSFIILDNGLDIKVMPSGEKKADPSLISYIGKGYIPKRKDKII